MEKQLLTRLDHPHIVRILGSGKLPRPFLILEKLKDVSMLLDLHADGTRHATLLLVTVVPVVTVVTCVLPATLFVDDVDHACVLR